MPLPLTVSCFSNIQIGFTFLVPAHPGSPGKRAIKRVCVCVCVCVRARVCNWPYYPCQLILDAVQTTPSQITLILSHTQMNKQTNITQ